MEFPQTFTLSLKLTPNDKQFTIPKKLQVFQCSVFWNLMLNEQDQEEHSFIQLQCFPGIAGQRSFKWHVEATRIQFYILHGSQRVHFDPMSFTFRADHVTVPVQRVSVKDFREVYLARGHAAIECKVTVASVVGVMLWRKWEPTDKDDALSDVALISEGITYYSSKAILASHSSVFHSMFYGAGQSPNEVVINSYMPEALHTFLEIVHKSRYFSIRCHFLFSLLQLANDFKVDVVKRQVVDHFKNHFSSRNDLTRGSFLKVLSISERFKLPELEKIVLDNCTVEDLMTLRDPLPVTTLRAVHRRWCQLLSQ